MLSFLNSPFWEIGMPCGKGHPRKKRWEEDGMARHILPEPLLKTPFHSLSPWRIRIRLTCTPGMESIRTTDRSVMYVTPTRTPLCNASQDYGADRVLTFCMVPGAFERRSGSGNFLISFLKLPSDVKSMCAIAWSSVVRKSEHEQMARLR